MEEAWEVATVAAGSKVGAAMEEEVEGLLATATEVASEDKAGARGAAV